MGLLLYHLTSSASFLIRDSLLFFPSISPVRDGTLKVGKFPAQGEKIVLCKQKTNFRSRFSFSGERIFRYKSLRWKISFFPLSSPPLGLLLLFEERRKTTTLHPKWPDSVSYNFEVVFFLLCFPLVLMERGREVARISGELQCLF